MKLTYKRGKADKLHISVDGEYAFTVDCMFFLSLGIENNSDISEDELERLLRKVNVRRAFNKGVQLVSMREHSRRELLRKLREKGYGEGSEEAADRLEEYGYLDDRRFAENYAQELKRRKRIGERRIRQELYLKGIDRDTVDEVLDELELDPTEQITLLLEGKLNRYLCDEKGRVKCFNTLLRMGYDASDIRHALKSFQEEFDTFE